MGVFDLFLSAKVQKRRTCRLATPAGTGGRRQGMDGPESPKGKIHPHQKTQLLKMLLQNKENK